MRWVILSCCAIICNASYADLSSGEQPKPRHHRKMGLPFPVKSWPISPSDSISLKRLGALLHDVRSQIPGHDLLGLSWYSEEFRPVLGIADRPAA